MRPSSVGLRAGLLFAAIAIAGCERTTGGGIPVPTDTGLIGGSTSCGITLSGSLSGTFLCVAPVGSWISASNDGSVETSINPPPSIVVTLRFLGPPAVGTRKHSDNGASSGVTITRGTAQWAAIAPTSASAGQGTYTLTLTSVTVVSTIFGTTTYSMHGTLDATLAPSTGSTALGNLTLHASF